MSYDAGVRFLTLLAFVASGGAVLIAALRLVPATRRHVALLTDAALWLAWLVAAVSMAGSLWFSEGQNFVPCKLCWYQRIAMFSLAVVLLVGALRRNRDVRWYAVPLAGIGIVISTYHYLLEWNPQWEGDSCDITAPCAVPYFREFGFVSLAFMALCGFAAILSLLLFVPAPRDQTGIDDGSAETSREAADVLP